MLKQKRVGVLMLRHLDLFSGIGGFALAAQMVGGINTEQFVEIDPFCQKILTKNFPGVPIHGDIRTYTANPGQFDLITFGSPCQDVSTAGKGAGIKEGTRSGLFLEAIRIIRVVRPRFAVMENVAGLLANGMGIVLEEFSKIGFDVEWSVVSCAEVGGVHLRERVWIVAYPNGIGHQKPIARNTTRNSKRNDTPCELGGAAIVHEAISSGSTSPNAHRIRCRRGSYSQRINRDQIYEERHPTKVFKSRRKRQCRVESICATAPNAESYRLQRICSGEICFRLPKKRIQPQLARVFTVGESGISPHAMQPRLETRQRSASRSTAIGESKRSRCLPFRGQENKVEPSFRMSDDGLPGELDRPYLMILEDLPYLLPIATDSESIPNRKEQLQALGNAVVPHVAAIALQRIVAPLIKERS